MKILLVTPSVSMSIADVSRGYRRALERAGHQICEYSMKARYTYHQKALPEGVPPEILCRQASENIALEALYGEVDLVLIISGLNVHPIALWSLAKLKIPAAVILTESPYDDEFQKQWVDLTHVGIDTKAKVFTNDRSSAETYGWTLLAPSFDPEFHKPSPVSKDHVCDVVMVGTGWRERQAFLEYADWTGIDLRLYGNWPDLDEKSPLFKFYRPGIVDNAQISEIYSSAKICLNFHRASRLAKTPGPRVYELAACGAFQLSDSREDLSSLFGMTVPTFTSPKQLQEQVKYFLKNEGQRASLADQARHLVQNETFDSRVCDLISAIS